MSFKWILKTIKGYTVCLVNTNGTFMVRHRPFRCPDINFKKNNKEINGYKMDLVIVDELCEISDKIYSSLLVKED